MADNDEISQTPQNPAQGTNPQNPPNANNAENGENAENPANAPKKNVIRLDKKLNPLPRIKAILAGIGGKIAKVLGGIFGAIVGKAKGLSGLKEKFRDKKFLAIFGGICAVIIIAIAVLVSILNKEEPLEQVYAPLPSQASARNDASTILRPIKAGELQILIQKAALLYNSGHIAEALEIYSNIAVFSQSFANFNLGVSKFKEKNYQDSIDIFANVIDSGDNVAAAAINSAVSAHILRNPKLYNYYVELAKGTMINWYDMPLYSYLYSLVNYYLGKYFNTLSSLKNPNSTAYRNEHSILLSKMYLMYNDDYNALKTLLENNYVDNRFAIGLLYARMGEYDLAFEQIDSYLRDTSLDNPQGRMAQALIDIKRSNFGDVSNTYEELLATRTNDDLQAIYPIKIKLTDSLFDINQVQKYFWDRSVRQHLTINYKILFYFAPFRVFDIDNAMMMIEEGGLSLRMNNIEEASNILTRGAMLSRINANITQSLKELLQYNIYSALEIMHQAADSYPNHQVLQYNLGLIYAQLNDFESAKKHFLKAYHLDENDLISGIFALMCHQLTFSNSDRITSEITYNFENTPFTSQRQEGFLRSLFGYVNGNLGDDLLWFDDEAKNTPIMATLRALFALNTQDKAVISSAFNDLKTATNNDMVSVILHRIVSHYNENIKLLSLTLFDFFKNELKETGLINTGLALPRQLYIYMAFLVGANSYVDRKLSDDLLNAQGEVRGILESLALNAIYLGEFEKAFVYYNALIDDYKLNTSENYFLAGVAAIGAGHYDNAVALIQLSRMEGGTNFEAKYALGLLHQAMGNFKLASLQFAQIGNSGFISDFFDFEIDTSGILGE